MKAFALSSTIGAEITAPKFAPIRALLVAALTISPLIVFRTIAMKTATSAPHKNVVVNIHSGSDSYRSIHNKSMM